MPHKIFFIDDEVEILTIYFETLHSANRQIWTFSDPNLALEEIPRWNPHLIFLDNRLKNTTGLAIAHKIPKGIDVALVSGDLVVNGLERFSRVFEKSVDFLALEKYLQEHEKTRLSA
jgi:DNA-binding NtrC family response regulator